MIAPGRGVVYNTNVVGKESSEDEGTGQGSATRNPHLYGSEGSSPFTLSTPNTFLWTMGSHCGPMSRPQWNRAEPFSPHVGRKGSVEMMSPADFTRGALAFAGAWREWHPGGPAWEWQLAQGPFAAHLVSWPSDLDSVSH